MRTFLQTLFIGRNTRQLQVPTQVLTSGTACPLRFLVFACRSRHRRAILAPPCGSRAKPSLSHRPSCCALQRTCAHSAERSKQGSSALRLSCTPRQGGRSSRVMASFSCRSTAYLRLTKIRQCSCGRTRSKKTQSKSRSSRTGSTRHAWLVVPSGRSATTTLPGKSCAGRSNVVT